MVSNTQDLPGAQLVLRVFNGPLQGCEFTLERQRTLFIVGCETQFCSSTHLPTIPGDAIYIPLPSAGCNFEIVREDNLRSGCMLFPLSDEAVEPRVLVFQTLEHVGALQIAVRPDDEPWHPELLVPAIKAPEPVPARIPGSRAQQLSAGVLITVAIGLGIFGWGFTRPTPVSNVEALVAGASNAMTVLYGQDKAVYVLADSEREASWARQVMVRNGYAANQVLTLQDEQTRLSGVLADTFPTLAYHRLDLGNPGQPRLLISRQRNVLNPGLQQRIETVLRNAMPYAHDVQIVSSDDEHYVRRAQEGLNRLVLPYSREKNADSVTFTIKGSLEDAQLQALSNFVKAFNAQGGGRYVNFIIEMQDDWLKGKSFQYGTQGFVKMTPSSWYFPQPL